MQRTSNGLSRPRRSSGSPPVSRSFNPQVGEEARDPGQFLEGEQLLPGQEGA